MARLPWYSLAIAALLSVADHGPLHAETATPQPVVVSPFLYVADAVFLHHTSGPDSVDFIHRVSAMSGPDAGTTGIYASRFNAAGTRSLELKIDVGAPCGPMTPCTPQRAFVASATDYALAAQGPNATLVLAFVNRSTFASRVVSLPVPPGETVIDIAGNEKDALFVLTGAKPSAANKDLFGEVRIRKYSLTGTPLGPAKAIRTAVPGQTSLLGKQPDSGTSMIIRSAAAGDTVFLRVLESPGVNDRFLTFVKIDMATNTAAWAFRILNTNYATSLSTGYSPNIKAWALDGSGNITIAGLHVGADQLLPLNRTSLEGLPFIEDWKGLLVWHLRADGTLDSYCAWTIPDLNGASLHDYILSNIELQPFKDGTVIKADTNVFLNVNRGDSANVPMLAQTSPVGVSVIARLSSAGQLVWSTPVYRSDQATRDPRCCELKPQDLWSMRNSSADVMSDALIRVTAQSSRSPSYPITPGINFSPLDGEQVSVNLNISDSAPAAQFLKQQYLAGWRTYSVNFVQVSDAPN